MAERKIDPKFNIYETYKTMNVLNPYIFGGGVVASPIVQDGMVLHYDIGDNASYPNSGTLVTDLSPSGMDMQLNGTVEYFNTNGEVLFFNSPDDGVITGPNMALGANGFTFEAFVDFTLVSISTQYLFASTTTQSANTGLQISKSRCFFGYSSEAHVLDYGVPTGMLHFIFRRSEDGLSSQILINGVLVASKNFPNTISLTATTGKIGWPYSNNRLSTGNCFAGLLGVMRMYNRHLSDEEINQNFDAQRSRYGI